MATTQESWERTRASLLAFFGARLHDAHAAEDLVQETLLRVHAGLAGLRAAERLGPWVFRIARNVLVDHRRATALRPDAEPVEPARPPEEPGDLNALVASWLRAMISELPPEYREALELTELEGRTQAELARRAGLSPSGAKSRVQRARGRLRALLLECCRLELDAVGNVLAYERRRGCRDC